jgi:hypothetical protein
MEDMVFRSTGSKPVEGVVIVCQFMAGALKSPTIKKWEYWSAGRRQSRFDRKTSSSGVEEGER